MRYLDILASVCSLITALGASRTCQDQIIQVLEPNNSQAYNVAYFSGKFLNDLGDYEACTKSSNSQYALAILSMAEANSQLPLEFAIGLCVPSACNATDLNPLGTTLK